MDATVFRVILAGVIIAVGWGVYQVVNRSLLRRIRKRGLGLERFRPGTLGILYFTAPGCLPCKTVQQPALKELQELLDERIQVVQVDASQEPGLADHWGVLSVPTTFIIDERLRPRRVNHGVARTEKLLRQLAEIAGPGEPNLLPEMHIDMPSSI